MCGHYRTALRWQDTLETRFLECSPEINMNPFAPKISCPCDQLCHLSVELSMLYIGQVDRELCVGKVGAFRGNPDYFGKMSY